MNDLARILGLAGLATEQSVAAPADRELKEYGEEGCPCCGGGRCTCKGDCPDCNCHGNNEWDESVEEAYPEEDSELNAAGEAVMRRLHVSGKLEELVHEYGVEEVDSAIADATSFWEEGDEIGSSDVSGWARQAIEYLRGKPESWNEAAKPDFRDVDGDGDTEESWKDAEEDAEEMKESEWCGVCGNDTCSCTDTMVESPTMDTTQLVIMMRNAGLSEETITQKLEEWANTPEGVGEVEPTAHGDAYDFAQSVNLSLKRYLDSQDMKVQVTEHKVENMKALYAAHKAKK